MNHLQTIAAFLCLAPRASLSPGALTPKALRQATLPTKASRITGSLHRFQDDFGLGLAVGTPTFAADHLRLTLGGGVAFYPYALNASGEQDWASYGHVRLVVEGACEPPVARSGSTDSADQ